MRIKTPLQMYQRQVEIFKKARGNMERVLKMVAKNGLDQAKKDMSGTVSYATLRKLGYPYGREIGGMQRGSLPLLPLHQHTRLLINSAVLINQGRTAIGVYKIRLSVGKGVKYAKYILSDGGTVRMVARGFKQSIEKRYRIDNRAFEDVFGTRVVLGFRSVK